jgi:hypothetical protein
MKDSERFEVLLPKQPEALQPRDATEKLRMTVAYQLGLADGLQELNRRLEETLHVKTR